MRAWRAVSAAFLLSALLTGGCDRKDGLPPRPEERPFSPRRGKLLYRKWCEACHGGEGRGDGLGWGEGRRPKPANLFLWRNRPPQALETFLSRGPGRNACPSWRKNFTPSEIRDLAAFLAALAEKEKKGPGKK